jgi:protein-S-isoprenylcysteine O-methyltransferase Ste14
MSREADMWSRVVAGVALCAVGVVWIAQGTGAMHGSSMTGHGGYAALGAVAVVLGLALFMWAWRVRKNRSKSTV